MTEEHIKEMLNGIINNGEKWECRALPHCGICFEEHCQTLCAHKWQPYKLGDEIHADWEYRKVETWCVFKCKDNIYLRGKKEILENDHIELIFEGTKEECEKWIEEHTKKSWLEEYMKSTCSNKFERDNTKIDITEVCKKILEEADKEVGLCSASYYLKLIIKDLGIEL